MKKSLVIATLLEADDLALLVRFWARHSAMQTSENCGSVQIWRPLQAVHAEVLYERAYLAV
ncbi:hypothetical protein FHS14_005328 [Paenibacillus baekrokdamisoli]|uniref:hypothetical protein n=1 Tax=Paenibacillus baekrokdamisoli TaxID=1712516 RepID=UPI00179FACBF|nr:hypothetical protein [Paenibacillus baekrokdamisoli]MBB3072296.1 hypothetical protein [Paenibacillus baekrokdamisoli]